MNLFSEVQGLKGEELTSAVLRILLLRSQEIRDGIIEKISAECPSGPIKAEFHFSCRSEVSMENEEQGKGRIDLLIEADDAIVGVENKLFADFQEGQPQKYWSNLRERAKQHGEDKRPVLVLLYPQQRQAVMLDKQKEMAGDDVVLLSWEEVNEVLRGKLRLDSATNMIAQEFSAYLVDQIAFLPHWDKWYPHLRRWRQRGSPIHRDVLKRLRGIIADNIGGKLGASPSWVGYTLKGPEGTNGVWFGFVDRTEIENLDGDRAELIVVPNNDSIRIDCPDLVPVKLSNPQVWGGKGGKTKGWKVDFKANWNESSRWIQALKPIRFRAGMRSSWTSVECGLGAVSIPNSDCTSKDNNCFTANS